MSSRNSKVVDLSVIIPFKDKSAMTADCVTSLLEYGPVVKEILLISNNSSDDELRNIKERTASYANVHVLEYNHPFNYQKMNNWAVSQSTGRLVMFLNNDTELRPASRGLLEKMVEKAEQADVGITGCLLLYGDERIIQHAGVFLVPEGLADHLYVGKKYSKAIKEAGTESFPYDISKDRPLTSVTGAVNIIERKKFEAVGCYDERFIICGGDVDLCIRLNKAGYQTWYVSGGYILHKESQTRSMKPIPFSDFYYSYLSYVTGYDPAVGDPYLPEITRKIKIHGV